MYCYSCGSYLQSDEYDARTGEQTQQRGQGRQPRSSQRSAESSGQDWGESSGQDGGESGSQHGGHGHSGDQWDPPAGRPGTRQGGRQSGSTQAEGRQRGVGPRQGGRYPGGGPRQGGRYQGAGHQQSGTYIEDGKLEYSLKFPVSRDYSAVGIGAALVFVSFLIVPIFTLLGYTYRLTGAAARGETIQPEFDELGAMTKEGFFYSLLYVGLTLPAVAGPVVIDVYLREALGSIAGIISIGLFFGISYITPAVMTLYPVTGSLSAALSPDRIASFALTSKYFLSYLLLAVSMIGLTIASFVGLIVLFFTVFGILLLIPLLYVLYAYLPYFFGAFWGGTYYQMVRDGQVEPARALQRDSFGTGRQRDSFGADRQRQSQYDDGADRQRQSQYDDGW
jgi:hypothetical protein